MRLSEGATFHVDEARDEYFRIVAFDEVTASNMVRISGPAHTMKTNMAIQQELGIPDSGHYPFIEQPVAFSTALRAFITETASSC